MKLSAIRHYLAPLFAPPIVLVRPDRLPDGEVTRVLKATPEAHLIYRAFMQLIDDAREDAIANIADDATNPTAMAADAGGAKYLKALRDDVLRRRAQKSSKL